MSCIPRQTFRSRVARVLRVWPRDIAFGVFGVVLVAIGIFVAHQEVVIVFGWAAVLVGTYRPWIRKLVVGSSGITLEQDLAAHANDPTGHFDRRTLETFTRFSALLLDSGSDAKQSVRQAINAVYQRWGDVAPEQRWTAVFCEICFALRYLPTAKRDVHGPGLEGFVASLDFLHRAALLLRVVALVHEEDAARILEVSVPAYRQLLDETQAMQR